MIEQFTKEQAIELYDSERWKEWSLEQIAYFQIRQQFLAIPFEKFHEAIEDVLDRPVWTHEFAQPENLIAEMEGILPAPTWEQLTEPIRDKMIVFEILNDEDLL